ncbi:biofilm PGA synthesis protein PgaA [Dyella sp. SG562]|uniref:poly-beta-1,6 N-acetyl-D-glucosamine export porin PgaA n=2 Tax=unclassified Dyella TaxID=2634549 RepID=UPI001421A988|nr:poly-beta-1,6 N-acetyl-D-glucosamine export porin PgaA [Dyella sp. SG562]NII75905.1 biofilm PGA synthesis protein PgaA [Dyella sp. SG562]
MRPQGHRPAPSDERHSSSAAMYPVPPRQRDRSAPARTGRGAGCAALATLAFALGGASLHASPANARDELLSRARSQHEAGHRLEALAACEDLLLRWPADADAQRLRIALLAELGAAGRALELAQQLSTPLPAAELARLQADAAAHQARWAQALPADTRHPYVEADRALSVRGESPADDAIAAADRMIALARASRSAEAVDAYRTLSRRGGALPAYADAPVADALLQQRQPEQAIPLYEAAAQAHSGPYSEDEADPRIGLAHAYLEAGRHRQARQWIDGVAAREPAWLPSPGSLRPRANPHKTEADLAAALVRQETWLYREAWQRLHTLRAEGPANAPVWNQLADVERARGWPRRAENTLMGAAGLDPDDTSIRLGAIEGWRDLNDFPRVEPAMRELEAVVPREPQVQMARQAWDRQRGWQFDLEHDRGRGGSPNFGDADHETQATLQSPLLDDRWRLYGITRLAFANLPEGHAQRERLGVGLRGYARGLEAYVQLLPAVGGATRRTAVEAGLRWLPDDHWTYALDWSNTGDADVPLRAHYYGIAAHALDASAQWRASELSAIKLSANADRYSDGNRRYGWEAAWTQRAYTAAWFTVDGGLQAGATRNSRSDVPYYSPSCARWAALTGRLENLLYQRYERSWSHRLELSFGSYDECRYGSGWMASAHYGQRWAPRGGLAFGWGIGWNSQPYDGKRDNRVMLDLTVHWGE